jgi:hypothetical protein
LVGERLSESSYTTTEYKERYWKNKRLAWRFCEQFKDELGSTMCDDIRLKIMGRDYDTMDPIQRQQFLDNGGAKKCRVPPEIAAKTAAMLLLEELPDAEEVRN